MVLVKRLRGIVEKVALQNENARQENQRMHDVAVAREQRCRVGVLDAQLHKVGPMMIVIALARARLCKSIQP